MDIQKRCLWCGKTFIAHKMNTLYCSKSCNEKAYKAKKKKESAEANANKGQTQLQPVFSIGDKIYLSPKDVAVLLEVDLSTVYRYIQVGHFKALRLSGRTRIRRCDLEAAFENAPAYTKRNYKKHQLSSGTTYTMKEIMEKFNISKKMVERRIDKYGIQKIYKGRNVLFNKAYIDKYFAELVMEFNPEDYYTVEQMMGKFNMSRPAVLSFAMRHKIPRITRHRIVYYSKVHIDSLKGTGDRIDPLYYTFNEIMDKYGFTKDQVSYYIHTYHIEHMKRGSNTMIRRDDFDKVIRERMNGSLTIAAINDKIDNKKILESEDTIETIPYIEEQEEPESQNYGKVQGYISAEEIAERYKQSTKWVHYLTRKKKVPRVQKGGILLYDEEQVKEIFGKYASAEGITEWYTTDDIEQIYNMTPVARRSFTHRHKIPNKKEYGITYYSKLHVDFAKNPGTQYAEDYYMVEQIMEKYHVDRDTVYRTLRYKKIAKVRDGQYCLYLKAAVDKVFGTKNDNETD